MSRTGSYTYDPQTGEWNPNNDGDTTPEQENSNSVRSNSEGNLTSTSSDKDESSGSVEKQYNTIEINTLSGTLNYIVTKQTIKLKAGDTVKLNGLGKYLSGNYYVKDVKRQIGSDGYTHSATLIKTDVGNSLKMETTSAMAKSPTQTEPSPQQSDNAQRTYTVQAGDCLWNIAAKYYGDGSMYTKIFDANTNQIADPNLIYPGQVLVIP